VDLRLTDGTQLVVRPIERGDGALLTAGVDGFSAETMRRRFLAPKHGLSRSELRYLTDVDFIDHHAVVAVHRDDPQRLAGVARWVREKDDPEAAEMAIVIADELQGKGLGTQLGFVLVDAALRHGVKRFTATMLAENVAARKMFARISRELHTHVERGTMALVADLAA
jgi:RimJ/RimL family protein N-acetyltransferase